MDSNYFGEPIFDDILSSFLNTNQVEPVFEFNTQPAETNAGQSKRNKRLAKNRECARKSRKKKKEYQELLEMRVKKLTEEISVLKSMKSESSGQNVPYVMNKYHEGKRELFDNLAFSLDAGDSWKSEELLAQLRGNLGTMGTDRQNTMKFMFEQIIDIMLPNYVQYLLFTSSQNTDIFEQSTDAKISAERFNFNILMNEMQLTEEQIQRIREYQYILQREREKFAEIAALLMEFQQKIEKRSMKLQMVIDNMQANLSTDQTARFILWLDAHQQIPMPAMLWKCNR